MASGAAAQATRTWVSGVGDDVNPCSRTAPCKTFAGAISKTAAGGEISCLDPGGFGAVTITKAMTLSCPYTEGGMLAGGNGIVVKAGPGDAVYIRGMDVFGVNPPANGVRFVSGGALHLEDMVIRRFNAQNSFGVSFAPTGDSKLYIRNSTIADNGNGQSGGGIGIAPEKGGKATVFVIGSTISNNAGTGISAAGPTTVYLSSTAVIGNATGLSGAKINSYGDNILAGNGSDGAFSAVVRKD